LANLLEQIANRLNHHADRFDRIEQKLDHILGLLHPGIATGLALELPTRTVKGALMANTELLNDAVYTVTIKATNQGGTTVPLPAGLTLTAVSSDPAALEAVIGVDASGNPAVVLTPLVDASPNITVTISDAAGLTPATKVFDIVIDTTAATLSLDMTDAAHVSQVSPVAPGP
jgi:hypothetical protein